MSVFYGTKRDSQLRPSPSAPQVVAPTTHNSNLRPPPAANPVNALFNMFQGAPDTPPHMHESIKLAPEPTEQPTCCSKYCSWASISYYKPYFQVNTETVFERVKQSLQFWAPQFFSLGRPYDLYGPFWIFTTLAFALGAVPNILKYQSSEPFNYNFELVGFSLGLMYTEGFGFAASLVMLMRCMGGSPEEIPYSSMICLYGYSHFITILAVLCCSINLSLLHYILLGYALASRLLFIIGNVSQLHVSPSKKTLVAGLIVGEAVLMFLIFKFYFIKAVSSSPPAITRNHFYYGPRHYYGL